MKPLLFASALAFLAAPALADTRHLCLTTDPASGSCTCHQDIVLRGDVIIWRWSQYGSACPSNPGSDHGRTTAPTPPTPEVPGGQDGGGTPVDPLPVNTDPCHRDWCGAGGSGVNPHLPKDAPDPEPEGAE